MFLRCIRLIFKYFIFAQPVLSNLEALPLEKSKSLVGKELKKGLELFNVVVNPFIYNYTIDPGAKICDQNVYLLIVVNSNPSAFEFRSSQRDTWAKRSLFPDVRVLFLMGQHEIESVNERIKLESNLYGDILQGNFKDSYRNLTLKGIMSLKWTKKYCSNIRYFLKTDDDVIIDLFLILNHLKSLDRAGLSPKKTILCAHIKDDTMPVIRSPLSKWYVSISEYQPDWYSEYCSGLGYIITSDLIEPMLDASKYVNFVWVDDFFMSGVLGTASNATYINLRGLYSIFDPIDKIMSYFMSSRHIKMIVHLKNTNVRSLIWFYILERQLENFIERNDFKSVGIQEFGHFDDFFWRNTTQKY